MKQCAQGIDIASSNSIVANDFIVKMHVHTCTLSVAIKGIPFMELHDEWVLVITCQCL